MKYRKKPIVIEAFQMTSERMNVNHEWPQWMHEAWNKDSAAEGALLRSISGRVAVQHNGSTIEVNEGDWIIRGVTGEIYPCPPDIFEATYETFFEPVHPPALCAH